MESLRQSALDVSIATYGLATPNLWMVQACETSPRPSSRVQPCLGSQNFDRVATPTGYAADPSPCNIVFTRTQSMVSEKKTLPQD